MISVESAEVGKYHDEHVYCKRFHSCCYYTEITVHPQSVNTTLNPTVNFTCEAVADEIIFKVNDISAANEDIINIGFIQQPQNTLSDGRKRRVLLAKALIDNNNTNIICRAIDSELVNSHKAVLMIQGNLVLDIMSDVNATYILSRLTSFC